MQIANDIHMLKIPFVLSIAPGKTLSRFVNLFVINSRNLCLIDGGVAGAKDIIFSYLKTLNRQPGEIKTLVLTHAHPDHVGGAAGIKSATGCQVAAHSLDVPWIEDVELQNRQRPVPGFNTIVEGSVKVDRVLKDGDLVDLGDGVDLRVIHTPGHSSGQIALYYEKEQALFSADCVPIPGEIPIYEDVLASLKSIEILQHFKGLKVLLPAWDEPKYGDQLYKALEDGRRNIQRVHDEVLKASGDDIMFIARNVVQALGLPAASLNPIFLKVVEAHLKLRDIKDLLKG